MRGAAAPRSAALGAGADVGFIDLDHSGQYRADVAVLHRLTDAVEHEPRRAIGAGFLVVPKLAVELVSTHALLAANDEEDCPYPLVQWDMAVLEDGADRRRELPLARATLVQLAGPQLGAVQHAIEAVGLRSAALRADGAVRPAHRLQEIAGFFL